MATIKRTAEGKVITKGGLPSCACCGIICSVFDLDLLLYTLHSDYLLDGYQFLLIDSGSVIDRDREGYQRHPACLRWLCREVAVSDGVIVSESNTEFGGPTTNGKDLWVDICEPLFGDETSSGTFLYVIEFYAWRLNTNDSSRPMEPADDSYNVDKYLVTKI